MKDFKGKVVVITGGSTGIGFSFAKQFGHEGAKIIICGLRENRIDEALSALKASGIEARICSAKVFILILLFPIRSKPFFSLLPNGIDEFSQILQSHDGKG